MMQTMCLIVLLGRHAHTQQGCMRHTPLIIMPVCIRVIYSQHSPQAMQALHKKNKVNAE